MSTNSNGESYVSALVPISGATAVGDFETEDHSGSYLYGPPTATNGELTVQDSGVPAIRTVVAGSSLFDTIDIQTFLNHQPGVVVLEKCTDTDLDSVIRRDSPDLVVIDLGAEDVSGSWRTNQDNHALRPLVLCVASNDQCAARAFQFRALDFLVRPFDQMRFGGAMERVRQELGARRHSLLGQQLLNLWKQSQRQDHADQLVFRVDGRLIFMDLNDIDWIGASANYVRVNAGPESHLVRESIGRLSRRLDPQRFVRIHRSVIVNIRRIKELHSCNAGEYLAVLKNGKQLPCSRGFRGELERHISRCIQVTNTGR